MSKAICKNWARNQSSGENHLRRQERPLFFFSPYRRYKKTKVKTACVLHNLTTVWGSRVEVSLNAVGKVHSHGVITSCCVENVQENCIFFSTAFNFP